MTTLTEGAIEKTCNTCRFGYWLDECDGYKPCWACLQMAMSGYCLVDIISTSDAEDMSLCDAWEPETV